MLVLRTSGNGVCGVHAFFGEPLPAVNGGLEFFFTRALEIAAAHLGPSLSTLLQVVDVRDKVEAIRDFFRDSFVAADLQASGSQTSEG